MKICTKCQQELPISSFNLKKMNKDGTPQLQSLCKSCNKIYQKEHYLQNKNHYANKARSWETNYKVKIYSILMEVCKDGCIECGEKSFACLQFNHIDPSTKIDSVSSMITNSKNIEFILEEVKKCEILCANCHAKKTAKQFGWYKDLV